MQKAKTKNTLNLKLGMGERAAGREGSWTPTGCQSFNPVRVRREILSSPRSVVARKQGSQKSSKICSHRVNTYMVMIQMKAHYMTSESTFFILYLEEHYRKRSCCLDVNSDYDSNLASTYG